MKAVALALVLGACAGTAGPSVTPTPPSPAARVRRLQPPRAIDPSITGAAYLTAVSARLQPGWGQFLDDCRLRLPASHALNQLALVATVDIVVEPSGGVSGLDIASSGNADFDHAVRDAIVDVSPLPAPPVALQSDDDRVHLRWVFARDDRQAGPATASVVHVELPVPAVVERLVARGELSRAARRIIGGDAALAETQAAVTRVMVAVLREALGSADGAARRAAIGAIARAHITELVPEVRALLAETGDAELRLVAIAAAGSLHDVASAPALVRQLPADLPDHPRLALAEIRALVQLGHAADAATAIRALIPAGRDQAGDHPPPPSIVLEALAIAPSAELAPEINEWLAHGNARARAGACMALAGLDADWRAIARGLGDNDATVRGACADAAAGHRAAAVKPTAGVLRALHDLAADRDRSARARGVAAILALDPEHAPRATEDAGPEVRAAYATALAGFVVTGTSATTGPSPKADLVELAGDRDADVRAAAVAALAQRGELTAQLASIAAGDAALQVRLAGIPVVADEPALVRLAADADPDVATAAAVRLAQLRGRGSSLRALLERVAATSPGSAERVRAAVAWLLAT